MQCNLNHLFMSLMVDHIYELLSFIALVARPDDESSQSQVTIFPIMTHD